MVKLLLLVGVNYSMGAFNLIDWLFPRSCLGCGWVGKYICEKCKLIIDFRPKQRCAVCNASAIDGITHARCREKFTIDGVWALAGYRGVIRQTIRKLKYGFGSEVSKELVKLMMDKLPEGLRKFDMVMPVPLHASRWRWRGFNQAGVLAKGLASSLNLPYKDWLVKVSPTLQQAQIEVRNERMKNLGEVFSLKKEVKGGDSLDKKILLIDDIATTGTTLRQAAVPLKRAGAAQVWGVVWAR